MTLKEYINKIGKAWLISRLYNMHIDNKHNAYLNRKNVSTSESQLRSISFLFYIPILKDIKNNISRLSTNNLGLSENDLLMMIDKLIVFFTNDLVSRMKYKSLFSGEEIINVLNIIYELINQIDEIELYSINRIMDFISSEVFFEISNYTCSIEEIISYNFDKCLYLYKRNINTIENHLRSLIKEILNYIYNLLGKSFFYNDIPNVEIKIKARKRKHTSLYERIMEFIKKNNKKGSMDPYIHCIEEIDERIMNYDKDYTEEDIKEIIIIALNHLDKGFNEVINRLLDELSKGKLYMNLLGCYIHDNLIEIYLLNILDEAKRNKVDLIRGVEITFAHEYFHFFHYLFISQKFLKRNDKEEIIEGLASWFEEYYARNKRSINKDYLTIAKKIRKSWELPISWYPYSRAKSIVNEIQFKMLFDSTTI